MTVGGDRQDPPLLNRAAIEEFLPHRDPFLLLDRVVSIEGERRLVAERDVRSDEPWFPGHFPGRPILPGVLIIESLAQAAGVLAFHSMDHRGEQSVYFTSADHVRFRRPVVPGETLRLEVELLRRRGNVWRFRCEAFVGEHRVAEALVQAVAGERILGARPPVEPDRGPDSS